MGIYLIRTNTGMIESPFFGGVTINNIKVANRLTPFSFKGEYNYIEFEIEVSPLEKEWDIDTRRKVGQWLFKDEYKPFIFSDDLSKVYYAKASDASTLHTYSNKGYLKLKFVTNSPFAWSPVQIEEYDLKNKSKETIEIFNHSNAVKYYYPKIEIQNTSGETFRVRNGKKEYSNKITIKNISNNNQTVVIDGFEGKDERISIDCQNELILSDLYDSKPFQRFNQEWLELVQGRNIIEISGKCKLWTKMQFPILQ